MENLKFQKRARADGLKVEPKQPECQDCEYRSISQENLTALAIYDLACPWGDLDYKGLEMALSVYGIRGSKRKIFIKKAVTIHRILKEHYGRDK
jgi:hypothetical protein